MLFCAGLSVDVGTDGVRATLSAGRSVMMSPPREFTVGAGVCVCYKAGHTAIGFPLWTGVEAGFAGGGAEGLLFEADGS